MNQWEEEEVAAKLALPVARVRAVRREAEASLRDLLAEGESAAGRDRFRATRTAAVMRRLLAGWRPKKKPRPARGSRGEG